MDIDSIVKQISLSSKYRDLEICKDTIRKLILDELKQHRSEKLAIKAAKKKLHRIVAPYLGDPDYTLVIERLEFAFRDGDITSVKDCCAQIMAEHASTRERLSILDNFYARIFEVTGKPSVILDLACGVSPLSFPWMELSTSTSYYAYDIHQTRIDFLNKYFLLQGLLPLARVQDILIQSPEEVADIALILKEIHRFEQRQRGCTLSLMDALSVRYVIVSLPTRNQTGQWDLKERHRDLLYKIVQHRPWNIVEIEFDSEIVFCVNKSSA